MIFLLRIFTVVRREIATVCWTLFLVLIFRLAPAFCAEQNLAAFISVLEDQEGSGSLTFTLTNISQSPVRLLRWNTPLEGAIVGDIFSVTRDGKKIRYKGKQVKRALPGPGDYLTIRAGESVSAVTSLLPAYDIRKRGQYEVRYTAVVDHSLEDGSAKSRPVLEKVRSNTLLLDIRVLPEPAVTTWQDMTYSSCSAGRKVILDNALDEAGKYAEESLAAIRSREAEDRYAAKRYTAWFGTYSAGRYAVVEEHFTKLAAALTGETIEFRCDCTENYLAYVYADQPYIIHLCGEYWQAAPSGADSQAGTLIHEMSHFTLVTATEDFAYGQEGALELAEANPGQAITNADSHEYFAENMPFLPMTAVYLPANMFADAAAFNSIPLYAMGDSTTAGKEPGEPDHADAAGGSSVWVTWLASINGRVRVSTIGSLFDTVLAVYTGDEVGSLTLVAANDDADNNVPTLQSAVAFTAEYGHTYHFAVDGYGGDSGVVYIALTSESGDIDQNGAIDLADLLLSLQVLSGGQPAGPVFKEADVNGDGEIGIVEAVYILQSVVANPYN